MENIKSKEVIIMKKLECSIFRGGTSKGIFIKEENLPKNKREWDKILLAIMGSPDIRQIDGLGGATSTTSKVAIISKSNNKNWDINYTFAQVSIDKPIVTYKGNCGNISSAVGPYAIEKGLVKVTGDETLVRVYNTNTKKIIYCYVKTKNGNVNYYGDFNIAGVPGTSTAVKLAFKNPAGSITGKLLPTGNVIDKLEIPGYGTIEASIVDSSNPLVFIRANDIGLTGKELPEEIDKSKDILDLLEKIRGIAAVKLGFIKNYKDSSTISPSIPKMTIIEKAKNYKDINGNIVEEKDIDILGRMMSMQLSHKTYAFTGALCTVTAASIDGTIVNKLVKKDFNRLNLRIGNPAGIIKVGVEKSENNKDILWVYGYRTARIIMDGYVYIK